MSGLAAGDGRGRVSAEQLELLLSFMEEHADFAHGRHAVYSRYSSSKLWRLLAERLNAAAGGGDGNGALKSPDKWCRYWADIKYRARKKGMTSEPSELSSVDERVRGILTSGGCVGPRGPGPLGRAPPPDPDDERKPLDDDAYSEGSGSAALATEEMLAEAAMRTALAAEKQAEAVSQGVELLRELVGLLRERTAAPAQAPLMTDHMQHHHHRL